MAQAQPGPSISTSRSRSLPGPFSRRRAGRVSLFSRQIGKVRWEFRAGRQISGRLFSRAHCNFRSCRCGRWRAIPTRISRFPRRLRCGKLRRPLAKHRERLRDAAQRQNDQSPRAPCAIVRCSLAINGLIEFHRWRTAEGSLRRVGRAKIPQDRDLQAAYMIG